MDLASMFLNAVRQNREKVVLYHGESSLTYGQLSCLSRQVAAHLIEHHGIQPGDRVAIWMDNCTEFITCFLGILQCGAVVVPINHFLTYHEAEGILCDAEARVVLVDSKHQQASEPMQRWQGSIDSPSESCLRTKQDSLPNPSLPANRSPQASEDDLAVLIYTSGTTGNPKGAMLTHRNLLHNATSCRHTMAVTQADRVAVVLPLFHSFMLTVGVIMPILCGASILLLKSLHPARRVLQEICRRHATILPAIPQLYRAWASMDLPKLPLRLCISGAAPLPMEILKRFNRSSPAPIIESYGLSEASPVVTLNPIAGPQKPGSIGLPIHDVEVAIKDEAGKQLPAGETGELWVRGANVMLGYWKREEATREVLCEGWLKTGDMGHQDAEGFLYVTDRKKDMLLVNGINVYPREIEEIIYRYDGVKEASVVGKPDGRKGEQPVAFVVMEDGVSAQAIDLASFLKPQLASYKVPQQIHFLESLPRTATGKVQKTRLREKLLGAD
jgi:long-chain acyl-CoA synthetase